MNRSVLSHVFTALAGGLCAAVLVTLLNGDGDSRGSAAADGSAARASRSATPAVGSVDGAGPGAAEALALLSNEVNRLAARVDALERRPEPEARVALAGPSEVQAESSALAAEAALAPEVVQESVAAALETIRADERAKAEAERQQRELERIEERLTRLNERLALSPDQTNMMRALMLAQNTQRDELERMRDQGVDREQRRLAAEEAERRRSIELARILTPDQLAGLREVEASRGDDRGRSRRGNSAGGAGSGNNGGGGNAGGRRGG